MLEKLERVLKNMKMARKIYPGTPEKYLKQIDKKIPALERDIDRIYSSYSKLHQLEEKIAAKYNLYDLD